MTEKEYAVSGIRSAGADYVSNKENIGKESLENNIINGKAVILHNKDRNKFVGIGKNMATKINASIGTSTNHIDPDEEIRKAIIAENAGADTLMELSVGGDLDAIRREILNNTTLPVGTVPLYQAFREAIDRYKNPIKMSENLVFDIIEKQCADGISFMAIHSGLNLMSLERLKKQSYRYAGLVSKGGAYLVAWMLENNKENPLYERFEDVLKILKKYDTVLSLGNGLRAGSTADSFDRAYMQELIINCELCDIARDYGVQVIVEGPGHIPIDEIEANVKIQKKMSGDAPFYVLGPLVTDVAAGYDHISSAIGGALSSSYGADFLCYVTPAEHLGLPSEKDVEIGVKSAKIAAHVGDMVKLKKTGDDMNISKARRNVDWENQFRYSIDPEYSRALFKSKNRDDAAGCSMCGEFCAPLMIEKYFRYEIKQGKKS
ncbi:MAG TPA: phosphomethylpyrimidine synthase ThiC [bacterium]|mgnify:CR=1 FL=1|nr:phosphomethylpyrimidine synthase ThiC [bacterium]